MNTNKTKVYTSEFLKACMKGNLELASKLINKK